MEEFKDSNVSSEDFKGRETINSKGIIKLSDLDDKIVGSAPISIMATDKNGAVTFANKYFEKISSEKSLLHKNIFEVPFFIQEKLSVGYKKLLSDGLSFKKESCDSMDKSRCINIMAVPIKNENGGIEGSFSMAADVTEISRAKSELAKLNGELEGKVAEKTRQLEESIKVKSRFISDASHELRTPLAVAKLNLELLKKKIMVENKEATEVLDEIDSEINKVASILSDIAFFTDIDDDSVEKMNMENIDLNEFMEVLTERVKQSAGKKNIDIVFKKNGLIPVIKGDRMKLEKLFLNIMGNSTKYGKESGWIKISIESDSENKLVRIIISDNGAGIEKKDLPYIFDRFYRTDMSRSGGEGGFGLGLTICKWIAEHHDGSITVESAEGTGSVFTTTLPVNN